MFSLVGLVFVLAMNAFVPNLGLVFGLAGSLGLGLIAFCLPTVTYLALLGSRSWTVTLMATVVLIAGVVMTVGSTTKILISAINATGHEPHHNQTIMLP